MGIRMGQPVFQKMARDKDTPDQVIVEAFRKDKQMELLVIVLPGKTPFYGKLIGHVTEVKYFWFVNML